MTKRLVDIDDQLLERARAATGEKTIKGTIEASLKMAAKDELIERHIARLRRANYDLSPEEFRALRERGFAAPDRDA